MRAVVMQTGRDGQCRLPIMSAAMVGVQTCKCREIAVVARIAVKCRDSVLWSR